MIQGCRYSRRSTDRSTLSKNSTTRQRTQGFGVKPICIENVSNENTYIQGLYLYPITAWPRMDLIPNLSLNAIAYPSIRPFPLGPRHHTIPQNQRNSSPAERKQIADRGHFCWILLKKPSLFRTDSSPRWTHRSGPLPNFGVNTIHLFDKHKIQNTQTEIY
jgi:hypothetical protein